MFKTFFCRRLPAPRLPAVLGLFPSGRSGKGRLADICQLADGALLLDWENGSRELVSRAPAGAAEFVGLRRTGISGVAGLTAALFRKVSGIFESGGRLSVVPILQNNLGSIPGTGFRSFLAAPSLSGHGKHLSFEKVKCASLQIGDEECWFDVANHIEPFCLSYSNSSSEALNLFDGSLPPEFKHRLENTFFYPLRDRDMLTGWSGLPEAAASAGRAAGKGEGIMLDSGCLAQACGVNSSDIAEGLRSKGAGFVVLTTPVSRAEQTAVRARAGKAGNVPGRSVDFFNARGEAFRSELRALCEGAGLAVNSFCFPDYSREKAASYGKARTRVVFFSAGNPAAVRDILADGSGGVLVSDACFGPRQMSALARELSAAAGSGSRTVRGKGSPRSAASGRFAAVKRALSGRRIAVVLDVNEFHLAVANWVPELRQAVLEAGFRRGAELEDAPLETSSRLKAVSGDTGAVLDFFLLSPYGLLPGLGREMARIIRTAFPGASVKVCCSEAGLYSALKASGARGIFSAYCFDDRVLSCGKIPLDLERVGAGTLSALTGYEIFARKLSAGLFREGRV